MPKRKANKVRSDGRFRVKYNGRQFYGKTNAEAVRKMEEYKQLEKDGLNIREAENTSVAEYATKWLPIHKASVTKKVYNDYAKKVDVLISYVGSKRIMDVTPSDIKHIYSTHYLKFSDVQIKSVAALYRGIFESARDDRLILVNPCDSKSAKPHRGTEGTHRAITDEERLLIETVPHKFQLAAMIMLYAGLRRGEVLALDLKKDIERGESWVIHVRHSIRFEDGYGVLVDPKTASGIRDVPVIDKLKNYLESLGELEDTSIETRTHHSFEYGWKKYMMYLSEAAGKTISMRPHDLRHSYCTMLRDAGVDMHLAMNWMGHANERMILRIYDHINENRIKNAVENVNKYTKGVQMRVQNDNTSEKNQ